MKKYFVFILLFSWCGFCFSRIRNNSDLIVRHYTQEDGLSNDVVYCSLKTRDGFLWFGTWYGLCRFDGTFFQAYTTTLVAASDQPPRKVETLVEDGSGNIWIKTLDWKLSVFFKQTERFEDVFAQLERYSHNIQIIKIQSSGDGGVLLLTKDKNLFYAHTDRNGRISVKLAASSKGLVNVFNSRLKHGYADVRGGRASWVGMDYVIFSVRLARNSSHSKTYWTRYFMKKAAQVNRYVDKQGCVWENDHDKALTYYNPDSGVRKRFLFSIFGKVTEPCFCDAGSSGMFYLTAAGEALHIDRKTLKAQNLALLYPMQDHHIHSRYLSMKIDRDKILWLTSAHNGVFCIDFPNRQFRLLSLPLKDHDGVRSLFQFPNGDVWVGTRGKDLLILDKNGRLKRIYSYDQYHIGSIYHIMRDRSENLWLSTKGDGLIKAVPDASCSGGYRFEHYRHDASNPESISGNQVYITYEDQFGRIWVGTLDGGLNMIATRGGRLVFKNKYNGMTGYPRYGLYMEVRNIVEDKYGRIWVGTMDGLMSFDSHFRSASSIRFDTYRNKVSKSLANVDVYDLYKDQRQNIWVCTFGGGVSRIVGYNPRTQVPKLVSLGTQDGLQNDVIVSIVEDPYGRLWLAHDKGISCYDYKLGFIHNFDRMDGFPDVSMEETAALMNSNGEIWMGCKDGIVSFRPDSLKISSKKYPVYIVGCEINNHDIREFIDHPLLNRSITYADHLVLNYDQNMFTLEFAALNFRNQDRMTYRYRLEGYDRNWHYTGHHRLASYTNVPPGDYIFRVESMDASNPSITNSRILSLRILPPWWATWWAYLIYVILFLVFMYFALRYILYQIRIHNDVYVQSKMSEFKMNFYLKQKDIKFINEVNRIISEHLSNKDFEIDTIAQQIGMSRSAFFKKMKQLTGLSPMDFVKEYKLNHSVNLLKNTQLSITEIAFQSGFSDVGYFGKCFKKKFGMSPRQFQRN